MKETSLFWDEHYRACRNIWAGTAGWLPDLPLGSKVLEAGCGNGKTISGMKKRGWDITGFDFSKNAARLCKENLPTDICAEILVSDAAKLPFREDTFDGVFARHITGHSEQNKRKKIAKELRRVLNPDGLIFFSEFEISDMRFGEGDKTEDNTFYKKNGILTHFFSEDEVNSLFPDMILISLETVKWPLKIMGKENTRAEIHAVFRKI